MTGVEVAVMNTLVSIMSTHGKLYCYPSQETILDRVAKYQGIVVCRRTLNYCLARLEINEMVVRTRRITRGPDGQYEFRSTMYKLGRKGWKWFKESMRMVAKLLKLPRVQDVAHYSSYLKRIIPSFLPKSIGVPKSTSNDEATMMKSRMWKTPEGPTLTQRLAKKETDTSRFPVASKNLKVDRGKGSPVEVARDWKKEMKEAYDEEYSKRSKWINHGEEV